MTAANVGGLFPPQSETLKVDIRDEHSPGIVEKVVYSGAHASSFAQAERDLAVLAEIDVDAKQVERMTHRVGGHLVEQSRQAVEEHQALLLAEKCRSPIPEPPSLGVIQVDGGRYQRRSDAEAEEPPDEAGMEEEPQEEEASHWREDKIGLLMTMDSEVHDEDPHPQLPKFFVDRKAVEKLVTEVGHGSLGAKGATSTDAPSASDPAASLTESVDDDEAEKAEEADYEPPTPLVRTMVATTQPIRYFGKLVAQAAWARGFAEATRKAFVADGASGNWSTWKKHFSEYTPILDFIHALTYVYSAATAVERTQQAAWETYCRWIGWIWSGNVTDVIAKLREQQRALGEPEPDEPKTSSRAQLAKALGYLENHRSRMRYDQYRKEGLPLTSCHIESTVKLFNKRVKGTEKFWSVRGAEAVLHLKAAYLSETGPMEAYWEKRYSAQTVHPEAALAA